MASATVIFEMEKAQALNIIDINKLSSFLYLHADDYVGKKNTASGTVNTTLEEEIAEVARLSHHAYLCEDVDYYRTAQAKRYVESDYKELIRNSENMYRRAAKKLLFLNSVAKNIDENKKSKGFLNVRISNEIEDIKALVNAFEFCVRYYTILAEDELGEGVA